MTLPPTRATYALFDFLWARFGSDPRFAAPAHLTTEPGGGEAPRAQEIDHAIDRPHHDTPSAA